MALPHRRDRPKLLQQAEKVNLYPALDRLAMSDAKDLEVRNRRMFAGRWDAHKSPLLFQVYPCRQLVRIA